MFTGYIAVLVTLNLIFISLVKGQSFVLLLLMLRNNLMHFHCVKTLYFFLFYVDIIVPAVT